MEWTCGESPNETIIYILIPARVRVGVQFYFLFYIRTKSLKFGIKIRTLHFFQEFIHINKNGTNLVSHFSRETTHQATLANADLKLLSCPNRNEKFFNLQVRTIQLNGHQISNSKLERISNIIPRWWHPECKVKN